MMSFGDWQFLLLISWKQKVYRRSGALCCKGPQAVSCRSWEELQQTPDKTQSRAGIWTNVDSVHQEESQYFWRW